MRLDSTNPRKILAEMRGATVVEMRIAGHSLREIGKFLGISHTAVANAERKAFKELSKAKLAKTETSRNVQVARHELQIRRLNDIANDPEQLALTRIAAINAITKIDERVSRLTGTDAPTLVESKSLTVVAMTDEQEARMISRLPHQPTIAHAASSDD